MMLRSTCRIALPRATLRCLSFKGGAKERASAKSKDKVKKPVYDPKAMHQDQRVERTDSPEDKRLLKELAEWMDTWRTKVKELGFQLEEELQDFMKEWFDRYSLDKKTQLEMAREFQELRLRAKQEAMAAIPTQALWTAAMKRSTDKIPPEGMPLPSQPFKPSKDEVDPLAHLDRGFGEEEKASKKKVKKSKKSKSKK